MDEMTASRLTTIDNPYDPFEQFDLWYMFDINQGHNCCAIVGRLYTGRKGSTPFEENEDIERALDDFIACEPTNLYVKVKKGEFEKSKKAFKEAYDKLKQAEQRP